MNETQLENVKQSIEQRFSGVLNMYCFMNRTVRSAWVVNTLTSDLSGKLKLGMVIALEPKCISPGQGVVGLEDDYIVTSSGLENFPHPVPRFGFFYQTFTHSGLTCS